MKEIPQVRFRERKKWRVRPLASCTTIKIELQEKNIEKFLLEMGNLSFGLMVNLDYNVKIARLA